ncbi:DUF547 domain-containing protein [soil metagenome]
MTAHASLDPGSVPATSAALLAAVRSGDAERARAIRSHLAALEPAALARELPSDAERVATWVNLYNAAARQLVDSDLTRVRHRLSSFRRPVITVAGTPLSLDAVEHGLLRRSRWKIGLGWLGNPWPGDFERRYRVERVDPRIHFVLNCAAASCPPIDAYLPGRLDAQLDVATRGYLATCVRRDGSRLVVPRLFLWFSGDFGGPAGVRRFLLRHGVDAMGGRLTYTAWDWTASPAPWAPKGPTPGTRVGPDGQDEGMDGG